MAHCSFTVLAIVFLFSVYLDSYGLSRIQPKYEDNKGFKYQNRSCEDLPHLGACYSTPVVNRSCSKSCITCDCNNGTDVVRKQEEDSKKESHLRECCSSKGVSGKCHRLCSFRTTTSDMFNAGLGCVAQLPDFMNCAAHGKPKLECCAFFHVPAVCKSMCTGELKRVTIEHLPCLSYAQQILGCHNAGYNS